MNTPLPEKSPQCDSDAHPLWSPCEDLKSLTRLSHFMELMGYGVDEVFEDYHSFWEWSRNYPEDFWVAVWDYCQVSGKKSIEPLINKDDMIKAKFFPTAEINYAENVLKYRTDKPAIISRKETGEESTLTFNQLYDQVSLWAQAFKNAGIIKGDRIAGYLPNTPEAIIAMLGAASLGAIWASASPDFGIQGVIDRFNQIKPKIMICVDGYHYNGKEVDCLEKIKEIQGRIDSLEKTIIVPYLSANYTQDKDRIAIDPETTKNLDTANTNLKSLSPLQHWIADHNFSHDILLQDVFLNGLTPQDIKFHHVLFNDPLFIMFSSGTTGAPKCIIHGHGGTLIQHLKEHQLQCNIHSNDKVFYFTTCGWMMWNWLVTALASEATLMLYDGSPFYPDGNVLWEFAQNHDCTFFGTSAKYIDALKSANLKPGETYDLSNLRTIASTGSPLAHESFDYVYEHIKKDLHLASISGGTDILSCFMLGNPISSVYRGELQGAGLGMSVDVFDNDGKPVAEGQSGDLVCTKPFPSMPVGFWNDPDNKKYKAAYFERFDNIWCHGDWVEKTPHNGYIIHGRSDATLNPGGVRIGTAEIYRQVEQIDEVQESICVGQDWDSDVRVILFVILTPGAQLNEELIKTIKTKIRAGASPRHVPAKVISVADIPRTKSGKITELAVRDTIMGRPIKNIEALANPQSLDLYKNIEELSS